ncbi:MAG TPA: carbon-nitrogen hydrolase family protein, partial [Anaerolineales bacterium]|nr:carbon-nitrogen hydrolase family protein [Anaerolineales bacterium]
NPLMDKTLSLAAIQMDVNPAPRPERLGRAGLILEQAAAAGARLAVLPELFNTGYAYVDENYARAESLDGPTLGWLKATSARLGLHLAGSLLLRDGDEIYNALLLVAPDGRTWRYDKRYPWSWERAYFCPGQGATVAETSLGRIGLMICWDVAHRNLWREYAGRVQLMLVCSCPPDASNPTYAFTDGRSFSLEDAGPLMRGMRDTGRHVFGRMLDEQAAWLGVPAACSVGCGQFHSTLPRSRALAALYLPVMPWIIRHLAINGLKALPLSLTCPMIPGCKLVDGDGSVLAERSQAEGEGFTLASVSLPQAPPQPQGPQPPRRADWMTYFLSDGLLPWLTASLYERKKDYYGTSPYSLP